MLLVLCFSVFVKVFKKQFFGVFCSKIYVDNYTWSAQLTLTQPIYVLYAWLWFARALRMPQYSRSATVLPRRVGRTVAVSVSVCLSVPTGRSVKCTSPRSVTRLAFLNRVYICHFCTIPECWQFHEHINARSIEWVVLVTSLLVCPLPLSISRKPHFWGLHDKSSMSPWLWQCITLCVSGLVDDVTWRKHANIDSTLSVGRLVGWSLISRMRWFVCFLLSIRS